MWTYHVNQQIQTDPLHEVDIILGLSDEQREHLAYKLGILESKNVQRFSHEVSQLHRDVRTFQKFHVLDLRDEEIKILSTL